MKDDQNTFLTQEEQRFVTRLASHYMPRPLTRGQQAAFDRALEERIAHRASFSLLRPAAFVATTVAAFFLWFALPSSDRETVTDSQQITSVQANKSNDTQPVRQDTLLSYMYYDAEFYGDENEEEDSFLPDEYQELMTAVAMSDS